MSKSRSRGRSGQAGTRALEVFSRPKQALPVQLLLVAWRWRWELVAITALIVAYQHLVEATGGFALLIMTGVLLALLIVPPTRRFIRTRTWCVIVRHRLRACMSEMRTLNYSGNLPFILHTHGTKVGESTWLWMRPGLSVDDLDGRTEQIAAASWARDVHITRSRRLAALVRVDTVRRDPLSAKAAVTSPLLGETSKLPAGELRELPESMFAGLAPTTDGTEPKPVHRPVDDTTSSSTRTNSRRTATATAVVDPVVTLNGEDVSDYV